MSRKFLAANKDIADEFINLAKKKGMTVTKLLNEILRNTIALEKNGLTLSKAVNEYLVVKTAQESGFILVPAELMYSLLDKAAPKTIEEVMDSWRNIGRWCGKCFSTRFTNSPHDLLKTYIANIIWGLSDFIVEDNDELINIRCIGSTLNEKYTRGIANFIEGFMESLDYKCIRKDVVKGIISLKLRKT